MLTLLGVAVVVVGFVLWRNLLLVVLAAALVTGLAAGLGNLERALPEDDARRGPLREAADEHLAASLPHVTGDSMGERWLPTFALLALSSSGE